MEELDWNGERCRRREPLDIHLSVGMPFEFLIKLSVLVVGAVKRLEGYQLNRIGGEVRGVFLFLAFGQVMLEFVQRVVQLGDDLPRPGEWVCQLIHLPTCCI